MEENNKKIIMKIKVWKRKTDSTIGVNGAFMYVHPFVPVLIIVAQDQKLPTMHVLE